METVAKKTKRSVVKREKIKAEKEAAKNGPSIAKLKEVPTSPRKMRLVADLIRGVHVSKALNVLKYEPKVGSLKLQKLLLSAIANWEHKNNMTVSADDYDLYIKTAFVGEGTMLKRFRPAPHGRAHRIRKRTNHVTLVVENRVALDNKYSSRDVSSDDVEVEEVVEETND